MAIFLAAVGFSDIINIRDNSSFLQVFLCIMTEKICGTIFHPAIVLKADRQNDLKEERP